MYCKKTGDVFGWPEPLPNRFENIIGGFDKLSNSELKGFGFYPFIDPVYDPETHELSGLIFDPVTETVTREVKEIVYDIEALRAKLLYNFDVFSKNFIVEIRDMFAAEILLNQLPAGVISLLEILKQRKTEVIAEINGFGDTNNIERLINYQFETEEVQQFRAALASLKE